MCKMVTPQAHSSLRPEMGHLRSTHSSRLREQPRGFDSGQGEGYESWRLLVLEYDPRSGVQQVL